MRVTVKICGLTSRDDAEAAAACGADYLGFVFFPASRRCLSERDAEWIRTIGACPTVGVFRDQDPEWVREVSERAALGMVQLHGSESPDDCERLGGRERVIKAVSVGGAVDWGAVRAYDAVARILFDTASATGGGTGRRFDWSLLTPRPRDLGFWLAGGLTPDSVATAIAVTGAVGVDVASGVEGQVGRKDRRRMCEFVRAVRGEGGGKMDGRST